MRPFMRIVTYWCSKDVALFSVAVMISTALPQTTRAMGVRTLPGFPTAACCG